MGSAHRSYWKPVYKYIRIKWQVGEDDAQDLTQEFFAGAMDRGFFCRFDPTRARFRTYLRVCLHGFVANQHKAAGRKKRGGEYRLLSLDFADAEGELRQLRLASDADPDEFFRQDSLPERSLAGSRARSIRFHSVSHSASPSASLSLSSSPRCRPRPASTTTGRSCYPARSLD